MTKITEGTSENKVISTKSVEKKVDLKLKLNTTKDTSSKRKIKDITVKKTSKKSHVVEEEKNISKKQQKTSRKSTKRTLHLNIDNPKKEVADVTPSISHVVDTSVNQNSPFFYEPSVFEKFNISVTSIDEEENTNQNLDKTTTEVSDEDNNQNLDETITEVSDKDTNQNLDETITEVLDEDNNQNLDETITEVLDEDNNQNLDETITEVLDEDNNQNFVENIFKEENKNNDDISNFFDSSIPSMETKNESSKITNIKKKFVSGISPIFKSFTFEESDLSNNPDLKETINNSIPNVELSPIQKNIPGDLINSEPVLEISAEPVATIQNLKTTTAINDLSNLPSEYDVNYNQIITSESNISDISVDDELINELIYNSDFLDENDIIENLTDKSLDDYESENLDDLANEILEDYELEDLENLTEESLNNYELEDLDGLTDEILEDYELENLDELSDGFLENYEIKDFNSIEEHENNEENYNDDNFSIESYFGLDNLTDENLENEKEIVETIKAEQHILPDENQENLSSKEFETQFFNDNSKSEEEVYEHKGKTQDSENSIENINIDSKESEITENVETNSLLQNPDLAVNFSKLIENFNQTISTLSNRIAQLEAEKEKILENQEKDNEPSENTDTTSISEENINIEDIDINKLDISLSDLEVSEQEIIEESISNNNEDQNNEDEKLSEDILTDTFLEEDINDNELISEIINDNNIDSENLDLENIIDKDIEDNLLEDILLENIYQEDLKNVNSEKSEETTTISELTDNQLEPASDFFTIIDSLSKTISDLENSPDIKNQNVSNKTPDNDGKSINILIDKDDIFSISILNETYEIVTDFDGISVLSENIHISTPKNNFFVEIGEKYIEIHKQKDQFLVNTNFEDVEFVNAINNVTFAKKNNKIELNIKEAFKLASANNKIELSMLNTSIANISSGTPENIDETSICDNRTLLISEETQKVYLPYTIEEIMKKLNNSDEYQTAKEVIENEYTLPLSTFKTPIIARFKEAYRFMRIKEKSSIYAAIDLGLELMFNSNLNPAVIRACKDLKELNIYLDCLYENEVDKFDCFKIVYKVLPKIQ